MILLKNIARACGLLTLCAVVSGCIVPTHYEQVGAGTNHAPVIVTDPPNPTIPPFLGIQQVPSRTSQVPFTIVVEDDEVDDELFARVFAVNSDGSLTAKLEPALPNTGDPIRQSSGTDQAQVCSGLTNTNVTWLLVVADRPFVSNSDSAELQSNVGPGHIDENHWEFSCP
jgi:hypothetical protein